MKCRKRIYYKDTQKALMWDVGSRASPCIKLRPCLSSTLHHRERMLNLRVHADEEHVTDVHIVRAVEPVSRPGLGSNAWC